MSSKYHLLLTVSLVLLSITLLFSSCTEGYTYKPKAVGPEGKMTVLIDSTRWNGPIGESIREALGGPIVTLPAPEPMFDVTRGVLSSNEAFRIIQKQKNVVIVAPLSDTTTVAQLLSSALGEQAKDQILSGTSAFIPKENLWSRDQLVAYVTAGTPEELSQAISDRQGDLQYAFNKITRERLHVDMFEKGRQFEVEQQLAEQYNFAVNVQHDYLIAEDTTNFVLMRRIISSESWRSLFIYFEEDANPNDLTPEWIYAKRDSLAELYMQGNVLGFAQIDRRRPLQTENIDFLGNYGFETRGLWHMVARDYEGFQPLGMGGPFLTYAFYDEESGRNYIIDGMVFAPNYPKREFLRQMEVIAYTFRAQTPESSADAVAAAD